MKDRLNLVRYRRMKIRGKIFYYIFLGGIPLSIYFLTYGTPDATDIGIFIISVSMVGAILFSPSDSYLKLLFRKMAKNFKSHKEKLKKDLEDEQ